MIANTDSIISAKGSSFFVSCIYEDIYLPPVYIREEEEEECLYMFLGAREIYTYLRFELIVEVWVGREMGDGRRETGKKKKREKEVMERMEFDLSFSFSLSRYLML